MEDWLFHCVPIQLVSSLHHWTGLQTAHLPGLYAQSVNLCLCFGLVAIGLHICACVRLTHFSKHQIAIIVNTETL